MMPGKDTAGTKAQWLDVLSRGRAGFISPQLLRAAHDQLDRAARQISASQ